VSDQTVFSLSTEAGRVSSVEISTNDRTILRTLAEKVASFASRSSENERRELWYRLNGLEDVRPVVFCDPENGWNEIITSSHMACEGELARRWEMVLRKEIFWAESMGDDRVCEAVFPISYIFEESDWGMHEKKIGGEEGGSYRWEPPLKDYDQLKDLHYPKIRVDRDKTDQLLALAESVFTGLLEVTLRAVWWWTLGMTWTLVNLRGLEQIMVDIYDNPAGLHALMAFLRDGHMKKLDFLESEGLLTLNNDGTYIGSGGFGWTRELPQKDFSGHVRTIDMWGFAESQETTYVSPVQFEEFIFPYQLPLLERFGLNCYGCCEPLDKRWDVVKRFPRLRRVSVSPWADLETMAEKLEDRYVFSLKPSPTDLASPSIDHEHIRRTLRKALEITKGCRVEVIMKDNHTIGNNPQNVIDWCRIAQEEAAHLGG